jgi:hypothetical protein
MALSRALTSAVALAVAALLVIGGGGVAVADQLEIDGDGVTPVTSNAASITACTDKPVQLTVLIAARRNGNPNTNTTNNVFRNGADVTVGFVSGTAGLTASLADGVIGLENTWQNTGTQNNLSGEVLAAVVTVPARGTSALTGGSVTFSYSGRNNSATGLVTGTASVNVNWGTPVTCITDSTAPSLSLPGTITAEATDPSGAVVTFSPTATDADPANPTVTCLPASGATFALGTTTVSCSATDAAGNTAADSFSVVVVDTTAPAVGAMSNITMEATGPTTAVSWTNPIATDAVSTAPAVTCAPTAGTEFAVGETLVTCSATDAAGNTGSSTFTVSISDETKPSLVLPAEFTVEATGAAGANVVYAASALDAVDGAVPVDCTPASGTLLGLGDTTVQCSATDAQGNAASGSFVVHVVDTTRPTVTVPDDLVVEATGPAGADVEFTAPSDDVVSGSGLATCVPASGSTFPLGATEVECTALDAAGNLGTASFTVTVVDTTMPQLDLPLTITAEAAGAAGAVVDFSATASDIVSGALTPSCDPAAGSTFALGTHQVDCEVSDAAGNTTTGSFAIYVVDTTGPTLTVPADITAEATGPGGAVVEYEASASDLVSGPVPPTCTPTSGGTFPLGTTTVQCTAEDAAGNDGSASFDVIVEDTTAPVITVPADITEEATGPAGAAVGYAVTADDTVDGAVTPVCVPAAGSTFGLGSTVVECTATDAAGNTAEARFGVGVVDTTAPVLEVPASVTEEATGSGGAAVDFTVTASDLVDGDVAPACTPASGSTFPLGVHTVDCTATDAAGNSSSGSFTVTVVDTTAPDLDVPDTITREATGPGGAVVGYSATASDLVDGALTPECSPESGAVFALGTHTVTCAVADSAGNVGEGAFEVKVVDTTAPSLTLPGASSAEATGPAGAAVTFTAAAADIVDGSVTPVCTPASGSTFALGATTVTCVATDSRGNAGSGSFTVTVVDTTAPAIVWQGGPADGATYVFGSVPPAGSCMATDLVVGPVPCVVTGYGTTVGAHTLTAAATDSANASAATRTYTVAKWTFSGFYQPVDMNGVLNVVKGGSTVPLKFEVFAGTTELTGTSAIKTFTQRQVTCGTTTGSDDIEITSTGGTTLRYDSTGGQFIQNWQTPKQPGVCYIVTVTMQDGSTLSASFKLK